MASGCAFKWTLLIGRKEQRAWGKTLNVAGAMTKPIFYFFSLSCSFCWRSKNQTLIDRQRRKQMSLWLTLTHTNACSHIYAHPACIDWALLRESRHITMAAIFRNLQQISRVRDGPRNLNLVTQPVAKENLQVNLSKSPVGVLWQMLKRGGKGRAGPHIRQVCSRNF